MPTFLIWHAENGTYATGKTLVADDVTQAAARILFELFDGSVVFGPDQLKLVPGDRWLALRKKSADYYLIEEVAATQLKE